MRSFGSLMAMPMLVVSVALLNMGAAHADKKKPEPKPTESITFNFSQVQIAYKTDGSSGGYVDVTGQLHLASQTFVADDGTPVSFTLHANLADASALSLDGTQSFQAVGAQDGVPSECTAFCAPPFWTFLFRLIPQRGPGSSFVFTLTVRTQYDADGNLVNACLDGQPGCGDFVQ
jgi:FtsP/CotA-like multicopper oxidase with cupredoxin domain